MTAAPPGQRWDSQHYAHHARFVATLGADLIDLLQPVPGERILDLGCGDGVLTKLLAERGATVLGIDGSADMVAAARRLGVAAEVMDGQALSVEGLFDGVFSNAALHWMTDADRVLQGVARTLRPGGRFVAECGGHGNVAAITVAITAVLGRRGVDARRDFPWYFPDPDSYGAKLAAHGFAVEQIRLIPRPTPLPTDMAGWLETFAGSFFARLEPAARPAALAEVLALLRPCLCDPQGRWTADYVRLRFVARRC
jgi:SAM-dependent methyltransferase